MFEKRKEKEKVAYNILTKNIANAQFFLFTFVVVDPVVCLFVYLLSCSGRDL